MLAWGFALFFVIGFKGFDSFWIGVGLGLVGAIVAGLIEYKIGEPERKAMREREKKAEEEFVNKNAERCGSEDKAREAYREELDRYKLDNTKEVAIFMKYELLAK